MKNGIGSKQFWKTTLVFGVLAVFAVSCIKQADRISVPLTSSETPDPAPQRVSNTTFKAFKHDVPEHVQFACNTCHFRDAEGIKSQLGGHESCIGCHLNEFIAEEQTMCIICHTDTKGSDPPVKAFPAKFIEGFNMKFDHAAHDSGEGRPANGCTSCHNTSGRGKTIPVGFQAHADCYGCHTAENKPASGQCNMCHQLAPYNRTLQSEYSFGTVSFTHQDHTQSSCTSCHRVRAGVPNSQQVANISIQEHKTRAGFNCRQCHNGGTAFDGNGPPGPACARCHPGMTYAALPSGTYVGDEAPATE